MGDVGIFFDPPYAVKDRSAVYACEDFEVAHKVRAWAIERGRIKTHRIVIAGYDEHKEELLNEGWTLHNYKVHGGYSHTGADFKAENESENRYRECLYFSPYCKTPRKMAPSLLDWGKR